MNVLEKILEEIEDRFEKLKKADDMCRTTAEYRHDCEDMKYFQSLMFATDRAKSIVEEIIRSHMNEVKGGWIQCSERLPEDNNKVLCTTIYGEILFCRYSWNLPHSNKKFFNTCGCSAVSGVVAWMPLPEPYKPNEGSDRDG